LILFYNNIVLGGVILKEGARKKEPQRISSFARKTDGCGFLKHAFALGNQLIL